MSKERPPHLKLTAAAKMDYPSAAEILVSFPDEWEMVGQLERGDIPLYIAAMPTTTERASRNHFPELAPEINLELTGYRLYKFFLAWPQPTLFVSWNQAAGEGRVAGQGDLQLQLRPIGQAQAWFGDDYALLWECYLHENEQTSDWHAELAAIWRAVEKDLGVRTVFTAPQDPIFPEGYPAFLSGLGYGPDEASPRWWCKHVE